MTSNGRDLASASQSQAPDYIAQWVAMTPAQKNYARRLIGQSSLEKKRAQEKHERRLAREEASAPSRERAAQLSIALGWTSPTIPTTGDDPHERARVMERERRARREKRDEHERLLFSHGRAHERLVITRELAAAQEAGAGVTRVRSLEERTRRLQIRSGAREGRESPLTIDQLYLDGVLPPVHDTTRKHQECSLCGHVKCHPVSYICGHSNCYACIRLHLETDWRCPHPACGRIMQGAPFRHESEEEGLRVDYPNWGNHARVSYSFDGLTFPVLPKWEPGFDSD